MDTGDVFWSEYLVSHLLSASFGFCCCYSPCQPAVSLATLLCAPSLFMLLPVELFGFVIESHTHISLLLKCLG